MPGVFPIGESGCSTGGSGRGSGPVSYSSVEEDFTSRIPVRVSWMWALTSAAESRTRRSFRFSFRIRGPQMPMVKGTTTKAARVSLPGDDHGSHHRGGELEDRRNHLSQLLRHQDPKLLHIVGEAGEDLAHLRLPEEGHVQVEEVVVDRVPQIPGHPLLDPGHEIGLQEVEDVLQGEDGQDKEDDPPDGFLGRSLQIDEPAQRSRSGSGPGCRPRH